MLCCTHLLYKWLISHLSKDITTIDGMSGHKWAQYFVSLTHKDIFWFPQILNRKDMILSYASFPNMPLIGSRGCIIYNSILVVRQLGHPLAHKPEGKLLEGLILQEATRNHPTIHMVIHDWGKLKKGILKRPMEESIIPYAQWMGERVHIIKLPFVLEGPVEPRAHVQIMIYVEEGNNLNAIILQLKKEREELEEKFYHTTCEKNQLDIDLNLEIEQLKKSEERTRMEEDQNEQAYAKLRVISSSLSAHKDELDRGWHQRDEWKNI